MARAAHVRVRLPSAARGMNLVVPNREEHSRAQDKRSRRRHKRTWQIECLNAWPQNFRRPVVRHEHHAALFLAFA